MVSSSVFIIIYGRAGFIKPLRANLSGGAQKPAQSFLEKRSIYLPPARAASPQGGMRIPVNAIRRRVYAHRREFASIPRRRFGQLIKGGAKRVSLNEGMMA